MKTEINFHKGDFVRITNKPDCHFWVSAMDITIGKYGIVLESSWLYARVILTNSKCSWNYPPMALRKVAQLEFNY